MTTASVASASTSEAVEYDIPPQLFDFTTYLSEFSNEVAGGAFGTIYRTGLRNNAKRFLAVKVPRRFMFRTQQDYIKVTLSFSPSPTKTSTDFWCVELQL